MWLGFGGSAGDGGSPISTPLPSLTMSGALALAVDWGISFSSLGFFLSSCRSAFSGLAGACHMIAGFQEGTHGRFKVS